MDKKIRELYSDYRNGRSDRRTFIRKLSLVTGSLCAATALVPVIDESFATDPDSFQGGKEPVSEFIKYPGETGQIRAFLAHPAEGKKFPAIVVIHENRGLVPHIQDVTKRFAKEGFLAMAPDALSPVGGTPEDVSNVGELFKKLDPDKTTKDFVAAVKYLKTHPLSNGKVGCTGFCWGGGMTNQVAVNSPDLDAAVPYYGMQPKEEDVAKIKAPIMAHYAGNDERIDAGIPAFEEALKKYGKDYQIFIYEGAQHAFNNDSNKERYNEQAAKLAWGRTVKFFKEKLG
jgi:carboxymethylenebutenolidase